MNRVKELQTISRAVHDNFVGAAIDEMDAKAARGLFSARFTGTDEQVSALAIYCSDTGFEYELIRGIGQSYILISWARPQ